MNPQEESNFLDNYQKNYFQENINDYFKTADIKRKCIAQTYKASHTLLNNAASCNLLSDMLTSYTDLVNDQNGINNYADSLKVLTSQIVEKDCAKWKRGLDSLDIDELLKPLACEKNCTDITDMKEQLNMLFEKNEEVQKPNVTKSNNPLNAFAFKKRADIQTNGNFQGSSSNIQTTSNNFQSNNNFTKNNQMPPTNKYVGNNVGTKTSFENRSTLNRNYCDIRNYTNTTTNSASVNSNRSNSAPVNSNRSNSAPVNSNRSNSAPVNSNRNNSQEEEQKSNKYSMFKTAKDELQEQSVKKYGKNGNNYQNVNPAVKKSLGTTRRGLNSKFVSPMMVDNDGNASTMQRKNSNQNIQPEQEEEVDERLKNIDPKMVELIRSEIMDNGTKVNWEDIAGLEFAKTAIQEAVVWPLLRPDIFTGLRRPPKGILLFGPPGTGKTLIGKCIASQSGSTFFSISASSLTSKWIGDGEKMVRAMFAVARVHQPAVIFIDEIDSLLSQRSDQEHESSRRIKTEFLVQLDGAATADDERILLVGATNRPQELDEAARRRFVKRLCIPLPEKAARLEIVKRLMTNERNDLSDEDMDQIADLSDGYSGADMKNLCSEASLGPIRSIDFKMIQNIQADEVRPVTMADFKSALQRVRASVSPADLDQYVVWDKTYGSGGW